MITFPDNKLPGSCVDPDLECGETSREHLQTQGRARSASSKGRALEKTMGNIHSVLGLVQIC